MPLAYTNRMGDTYYLHAGTTKTGKPRYFVAKAVGAGALDAVPEGFEVTESINGVVSVRRANPDDSRVPDLDLALVQAELGRHAHLRKHRASAVKDEIIIYEPDGVSVADAVDMMSKLLGVPPRHDHANLRDRTKYTPVMKFVPEAKGVYAVHRMTYRGAGGWSYPLVSGSLKTLVSKFVRHVGTEEFFELM